MNLVAVRDDGALLVCDGPAAVVVSSDGEWFTSYDAAVARGFWSRPLLSTVPPDVAAGLGDRLAERRAEIEAQSGKPVAAKFNPAQLRDEGGEDGGQWIRNPTAVIKDALKLAGRIDLDDDEHLLGSGKVDGDSGSIRMAVTNLRGSPSLRLGVGSTAFGGDPPWVGSPHVDDLDADFSGATGATARLDGKGIKALADLSPAVDEAERVARKRSDTYDEIERLREQGGHEDKVKALLAGILGPDGKSSYQVMAQGVIPGADWGDLHYEVFVDDPTYGAVTVLGVRPRDADADWELNGADWSGEFDRSEIRKFLRLLAQMTAAPKP